MTIDDAIVAFEQVASDDLDSIELDVRDFERLADWLRELKRAKMEIDLLKTLRDGFKADAQKYKAENAKLRELVVDMWHDGMCDCDRIVAPRGQYHCARCEYGYPERMKELGIEVNA